VSTPTPPPGPSDASRPSAEHEGTPSPVEQGPTPPPVEDLEDLDPAQVAEIESQAVDARVRRAPRFGAFLSSGIILGAVLGFALSKIVGAIRHDPTDNTSTAFFVALALAMVGGLVSGYLAVRADRRS